MTINPFRAHTGRYEDKPNERPLATLGLKGPLGPMRPGDVVDMISMMATMAIWLTRLPQSGLYFLGLVYYQ